MTMTTILRRHIVMMIPSLAVAPASSFEQELPSVPPIRPWLLLICYYDVSLIPGPSSALIHGNIVGGADCLAVVVAAAVELFVVSLKSCNLALP